MSYVSTIWNNLPANSTEAPLKTQEQQNGYVLLLVILSIFLVGSLIFISVLLITCRKCGRRGPCCARANDDPEKTNTPYLEESQPTHEITIRVDESECLSMGSAHDQETERFLSTGTTGRRVSFNEAALFDHGKKAQEKGRRYTLTEGDYHHLKNARLTNLHIPPPALKIVTIHECDSAENTITMTTRPATKSALSIFQPTLCPLPQTALTSLGVTSSCALPGDTLNSTVVASSVNDKSTARAANTCFIEMTSPTKGGAASVGQGATLTGDVNPLSSGSQGPVLQFLTKLRRHASLEGASPYFKIKKWKLDSSQRASSLDTRGSPKRRPFHRQRAASESMDQDDYDSHHIDLIQYIARTQDIPYSPSQPKSQLLASPSSPPPSLGRVEVEVVVEPLSHEGPEVIGLSPDPQDEAMSPTRKEREDPQSLYRDIWNLRASLEQCATSDQSSNNDRNSICSDADSVCSLGGHADAEQEDFARYPSQDFGDETEGSEDILVCTDERLKVKELKDTKQWSTESERGASDGETNTRKLMQMDSGYASIEVPSRGAEELRLFGSISSASGSPKDRTANEKRHHFTSAGRTGSIGKSFESHLFEEEPDDELLLGATGGASIKTGPQSWFPYGQMLTPREASPPPPHALLLHQRDYSVDEKTDALFHEFLRHDPQFDLQESPLKKHRSRMHVRKQWQRHKQWSDPGVRYFHSSFERHRTPLRRGDSVNYPLDSSHHSMLPRIVSGPDEESSEGSASQTPKVKLSTDVAIKDEPTRASPSPHASMSERDIRASEQVDPQEDSKPTGHPLDPLDDRWTPPPPNSSGYGPQTITSELSDKLTSNLEERLYTGISRTNDTVVELLTTTATHTSPDHSPV
ncbi:voltage-dependent calcium channel beta subunit-associated regulatory protein isoform 1-T1 [Synchiropus picturatus]